MKALKPSRILCPKCQNTFRAVNFHKFVPVYVAAFAVAIALFLLAWRARVAGPVPLFLVFVVFCALTEMGVSALVVRRGDFRKPD